MIVPQRNGSKFGPFQGPSDLFHLFSLWTNGYVSCWYLRRDKDTFGGNWICRRFTSKEQIAQKWDYVLRKTKNERGEETLIWRALFREAESDVGGLLIIAFVLKTSSYNFIYNLFTLGNICNTQNSSKVAGNWNCQLIDLWTSSRNNFFFLGNKKTLWLDSKTFL